MHSAMNTAPTSIVTRYNKRFVEPTLHYIYVQSLPLVYATPITAIIKFYSDNTVMEYYLRKYIKLLKRY